MAALIQKLLICAAVDGLHLHPAEAHDKDSRSVKIAYGTNEVVSYSEAAGHVSHGVKSIEAHGIAGILDLVTSAHVILITGREQVAQIHGKPVYAVKDVVLIPLSSQSDAAQAIASTQKSLKPGGATLDGAEDSDVGEDAEMSTDEHSEQSPPEAAALEPSKGPLEKGISSVRNAVQDPSRYGRFAQSWFSKSGWNGSGRKDQSKTDDESSMKEQKNEAAATVPEVEQETVPGTTQEGTVQQPSEEINERDAQASTSAPTSVLQSLTPRILRSAKLYFSSGGFFFSYEYDLSTTLTQQATTAKSLPLWRQFNHVYFWNRHLITPLIEAGQEAFVLPLLQGFVGQRAFSITRSEGTGQDVVDEVMQKAQEVVAVQAEPSDTARKEDSEEKFLLTLISRRSVNRAGLRYLRRGIDDEGHVANNVETEQILSTQSWDTSAKTFSLTQIRGSIPVFFSQTPYSFKPLPTKFGSETTNQAAFKKHFEEISGRYGKVQCASLIDKHGNEASIGEAYEHHAKLLNEHDGVHGEPVGFEWFDFHSACKGMKFENVAILIDTLQASLESFGWNVKQNNESAKQQTGVLRTNCMDCLDRTNVVQSAVAGWALQKQLGELGLSVDLKTDPKTQWFNTLWADNGDAISKQYAGTAALKGDFTRTRKRNWNGALSDFSLTLNRYYNNIFGDYFLQLNIDFFLGNIGPTAFDDFETNMMGQDHALDMRRVRQNAIDTCVKIVLEDPQEHLASGWTLSCPHKPNTLRSTPFEECVLLLTDTALYLCRFDWDAEKVGGFERIILSDITEIWRGVYITRTFGPSQMDESRNVGFALRYRTSGETNVRTNTRAVQNEKPVESENNGKNELEKQNQPEKNESRLLAFKALPPQSSAAKKEGQEASDLSEGELVKHVCGELHRLMTVAVRKERGVDHLEMDKVPPVEERDVVSAADARKGTGYIETLGYSLKKLVWS